MVVEELDNLKKKLDEQIKKEDSYDTIYETSVEIDKLLVKYYTELNNAKRDLNY